MSYKLIYKIFHSFVYIVDVKRVLIYVASLIVLCDGLGNLELVSFVSGHLPLALFQILKSFAAYVVLA